ELLLELKEGGADVGRRELVLGPVHCLWGLRPNTQYEVALGLVDAEPSLQLSFVTPSEDQADTTLSSLTAVLKDLGKIKTTVSSLEAAGASAELVRQLGSVQERWASLQVSCLAAEVQKVKDCNSELKEDLRLQLVPLLQELQRVQRALQAI
ncbi:unnamed protein product, partial [Effrenium voratum]